MISNEVKERLLQKDWYVECKTKQDADLVLQVCDEVGITWASGEKATEWCPFETYPFDICFYNDSYVISADNLNFCETYELKNITDWLFNAIKNNDSKLTPQNAHQEHMIQILLAKMQGIQVEYKVDDNDWCLAGPDCVSLDIKYRIAPQPTPLITREMWAMIAPEWKWAAMNESKNVDFFTHKPVLYKQEGIWGFNVGNYCNSVLAINTDGINWERSLTERPEDV